jgi:hypothetical protein
MGRQARCADAGQRQVVEIVRGIEAKKYKYEMDNLKYFVVPEIK